MSLILMRNCKNKNTNISERDRRKKDFSKERFDFIDQINTNIAVLSFCVILGLIFSGSFYLSQVNGIAIKGFDIRDAEKKIKTLEKQNEKLKIQEAELTSMSSIEKSIGDLNLVSSTNVSYVEINSSVAMR